jgi:starch synthase
MVSSEAAPYAKTGGLADVVGSLPPALGACGDEDAVVIPRYGSIDLKGLRRVYDNLPVFFGPARYDTSVFLAPEEYPLYLVDCPSLYSRDGFYGAGGKDYPDNDIRFAVLARAALGVARVLFRTDVLHCHDWQAGLIPAYLRGMFACDPTFLGVRTLFTIHNLGYQGVFPKNVLSKAALDSALDRPDAMEFFGKISYIKGGIMLADALSTVSPTYAHEIQTPEFGFGLDGALRARSGVLTGILNGVDYREWNPKTDPFIPARYSEQNLAGKRECKQNLLREFGLPEIAMDRPLLGIVSRFTQQKGIDLIGEVADDLVAEDLYLVALGTGEPEEEALVRQMVERHPQRIAAHIGFDNALAHRVEAGADIFLMPSRYEPSGLNQMYSLKYGTIPVVHAVGGLNDTIDEGTGFKFSEPSGQALLAAVREAGRAFSRPEVWRTLMLRGMAKDFSWSRSAGAYSALYRQLVGQR